MSIRTSANRYAKALFDVALQEKADLSKIGADLSEFAGVLSANRELALAAERAGVPETARVGIVDQVADKLGASAQVKKLLAMLTRDRKLVLAKDLAEAYQERLLAHQNIVLGELTSAAPIAPATAPGADSAAAVSWISGDWLRISSTRVIEAAPRSSCAMTQPKAATGQMLCDRRRKKVVSSPMVIRSRMIITLPAVTSASTLRPTTTASIGMKIDCSRASRTLAAT